MPMIVTRKIDRLLERRLVKEAQVKRARTTDTTDFERVAEKFREAVMNIRNIMAMTDTDRDYSTFYGGYEQMDALLSDPAYQNSREAKDAYAVLVGADQWLRHEADKLGEAYTPPEHFYRTWELAGISLRDLDV